MTEFEKELVRFVSGYLDAGVSAEDYIKAFSQRLLDSIGQQSKPKVSEGVEEEIERYIPTSLAVKFPTTDIETIKSDIRYIARHFAKWGAEHARDEMMKEAEKPCHTVEEWMEHIKNADQLTKDIFSKGPYDVLYDALNHPYRDCYDAIKEFGELCYQTAREDMMKEAVEGIAVINANAKDGGFGYVRSDYMPDDVLRGLGNFKLIIVKED